MLAEEWVSLIFCLSFSYAFQYTTGFLKIIGCSTSKLRMIIFIFIQAVGYGSKQAVPVASNINCVQTEIFQLFV